MWLTAVRFVHSRIYNVGQLKDLLKDKQVGENKYFAAEFFEPPSCPFYKVSISIGMFKTIAWR